MYANEKHGIKIGKGYGGKYAHNAYLRSHAVHKSKNPDNSTIEKCSISF